jgi:hypothetical protein
MQHYLITNQTSQDQPLKSGRLVLAPGERTLLALQPIERIQLAKILQVTPISATELPLYEASLNPVAVVTVTPSAKVRKSAPAEKVADKKGE